MNIYPASLKNDIISINAGAAPLVQQCYHAVISSNGIPPLIAPYNRNGSGSAFYTAAVYDDIYIDILTGIFAYTASRLQLSHGLTVGLGMDIQAAVGSGNNAPAVQYGAVH